MSKIYEDSKIRAKLPQVLVVDDPAVGNVCKRMLARAGIPAIQQHNPLEALALLEQHGSYTGNGHDIGMVMSGNMMRVMKGDELLGIVAEKYPGITRVLLSGTGFPADIQAHYVLGKPFQVEELVMTAEKGLGEYLLRIDQRTAAE
jgi:CheY-like chemotaxis protein